MAPPSRFRRRHAFARHASEQLTRSRLAFGFLSERKCAPHTGHAVNAQRRAG